MLTIRTIFVGASLIALATSCKPTEAQPPPEVSGRLLHTQEIENVRVELWATDRGPMTVVRGDLDASRSSAELRARLRQPSLVETYQALQEYATGVRGEVPQAIVEADEASAALLDIARPEAWAALDARRASGEPSVTHRASAFDVENRGDEPADIGLDAAVWDGAWTWQSQLSGSLAPQTWDTYYTYGGAGPVLQRARTSGSSNVAVAQFATPLEMKGHATTSFGYSMANRCAVNVRSGFDQIPAAPTGKIRYRSMGGKVLPPSNAKLAEFDDWESHVQSMARISLPWSDNQWAAVTRANPGVSGGAGLFLIGLGGVRGADGTRWVNAGDNFTGEPPADRRTFLYYPIAGTDHPGGLQAMGDYIVVASEGATGQPPFVDIFQRTFADTSYSPMQRLVLNGTLGEPVAPTRAITAAAMARLKDGRFLLFVLGKDDHQEGWFYVSDQTLPSATMTWSFLDYVAVPWLYQNVTLVTECTTGDIYMVATNNDDFQGPLDAGVEYADLLQVTWNAASSQVDLPLIAVRSFSPGSGAYCTFRAASNAFVDKQGKLNLYCHSHHSNTDIFGNADSKLKLVEFAPP